MRRLEYIWRLFGTGFSFVLFGLGGVIMSLTAFPLINLLIRDPERRAYFAQRLVHLVFQVYVRFMVLFGVIGFEVKGAEALAHDEGTLIVSNHPSLLDVVLLMSLMRRAQCIVKYEIWQNPFMRGVVSATGYISNDDDPEALIERCASVLNARNNLIIFPEGSRSVPGQAIKLQRGVANIAVRARAPIRVVTITCEPSILRKGQKWYQIQPTKAQFTIEVKGLVETDSFIGNSSPSIAARRLNAHLGGLLMGGMVDGRT